MVQRKSCWWDPNDGISVLIRREREGRDSAHHAGNLILDLAASIAVRNKLVLLQCPGLWHFVMAVLAD